MAFGVQKPPLPPSFTWDALPPGEQGMADDYCGGCDAVGIV
jgi:hypothetical protein